MIGWLFAAVALSAVGLALFWVSGRLRRRAGIPAGRIIYSDTRAWRECPKPLYAASVNLTGKPDYLVQRMNYVLPVEVKSGAAPPEPYRSHVLQLAAYCLLVENEYGRRPPYGLIHYADRTFAVNYTPELEDALKRFEATDMALHAAVTRRRLGAILGDRRGKALIEQADDWMRHEGILRPALMADVIAPGFGPSPDVRSDTREAPLRDRSATIHISLRSRR